MVAKRRISEPKVDQLSLLNQSKAAETKRKLQEQRAALDESQGSHQMSMEEQQAEYDEIQAEQEAERLGIPLARIEAAKTAGVPASMLVAAFKSEEGEPTRIELPGKLDAQLNPPEPVQHAPPQALAKRREEPNLPEQLFGQGADTGDISGEAGIVSAVAREEGELKAAIVLARQFPRNETNAEGAIRRSCGRPSFANSKVIYRFPRGSTEIKGPGVQLARELARCWGNLRHGIRIVSQTQDWIHVKGYCFDLETNNYIEHESKFEKLIQRKVGFGKNAKTVWIKPSDEREVRELVARQGAYPERNAILQCLPPDLIQLAMDLIEQTQLHGAAKDPVGETKRLLASFAAIGVLAEHIEEKYGHAPQALTAEEMVELRQIYASIRDGNSTVAEYFFVVVDDDDASNGSRTEALLGKLGSKNGRK